MKKIITEILNIISKHEAIEKRFFGPVYHGTNEDNRSKIEKDGFKIHYNSANGYKRVSYYNDIPPPIHHLGYGIYFTTIKAIAKRYNFNTTKGLNEYYLNINDNELYTFNFASPKKMMDWWLKNGYDGDLAKMGGEPGRIEATKKMTEFLSQKYKAIWFTGKSMKGHALDGDQIVIFDETLIYKIDSKLSIGVGPVIGAKVRRKEDNVAGVIKDIKNIGTAYIDHLKNTGTPIDFDLKYYKITWKKGGTTYNTKSNEFEVIA